MKVYMSAILSILFTSSSEGQEISVFPNVYINDIYKIAIPIPSGYQACYVPPNGSEHDLSVIRRASTCGSVVKTDYFKLSIIRALGSEADPEFIAQEFCGNKVAKKGDQQIASMDAFICSEPSASSITKIFTIRSLRDDSNHGNLVYIFTGDHFGGGEETGFLWELLSETRFIE